MSFYVDSVLDSYQGGVSISGSFSSYTYTRNLVDFMGGPHYYQEYVEIKFHAPDLATHLYKITTTVVATPTNDTPPVNGANQNQITDVDGGTFSYFGAANSPFVVPPYGGTATKTITSGLVPNGFGGYYYALHWTIDGLISWPMGFGLNRNGGTYSIVVTIEDVTGASIIVRPNTCRMLIEQN